MRYRGMPLRPTNTIIMAMIMDIGTSMVAMVPNRKSNPSKNELVGVNMDITSVSTKEAMRPHRSPVINPLP